MEWNLGGYCETCGDTGILGDLYRTCDDGSIRYYDMAWMWEEREAEWVTERKRGTEAHASNQDTEQIAPGDSRMIGPQDSTEGNLINRRGHWSNTDNHRGNQ